MADKKEILKMETSLYVLNSVANRFARYAKKNKHPLSELTGLHGKKFMDNSIYIVFGKTYEDWQIAMYYNDWRVIEITHRGSIQMPIDITPEYLQEIKDWAYQIIDSLERKDFNGYVKSVLWVDDEGCDLEVEVYYEYSAGRPARLYGPPEDCYPQEDCEFEIIHIVRTSDDVDIMDDLSDGDIEGITEKVREQHYADAAADLDCEY
jgi:hypothetical protein